MKAKKVNIKRKPCEILYKNEFAQNLKSLIWWTVIMAVLMFGLVAIYPLMTDMNALMEALPPEVWEAIVAMTGGDLTTITGYYVMEAGQTLLLVGAIFAGLLGASLVTRDIQKGSAEFLYALPVTRKDVWKSKLLVLITNVFVFNFVVSMLAFAGIMIFATETVAIGSYFVYAGLVLIMHLQIGLVAFALASMFKLRINFGLVLGGIFALFVLDIIRTIVDQAAFLKYVTPFAYAHGSAISGGLSSVNFWLLGIAVVSTVLLLAVGRERFKKIDLG